MTTKDTPRSLKFAVIAPEQSEPIAVFADEVDAKSFIKSFEPFFTPIIKKIEIYKYNIFD